MLDPSGAHVDYFTREHINEIGDMGQKVANYAALTASIRSVVHFHQHKGC